MDLSWQYGLKDIFLGIPISFSFSRWNAETFSICLKLNFVKPHKISTHSAYSDNCCFHFFYGLSDWVETLRGLTKFFFRPILKVSAFYLEKRKSFIPKKNLSSQCSYQNPKALSTDPIFSGGFGSNVLQKFWLHNGPL